MSEEMRKLAGEPSVTVAELAKTVKTGTSLSVIKTLSLCWEAIEEIREPVEGLVSVSTILSSCSSTRSSFIEISTLCGPAVSAGKVSVPLTPGAGEVTTKSKLSPCIASPPLRL